MAAGGLQDTFVRCLRVVPMSACSETGSLSAQRLIAGVYAAPAPGGLPSVAPTIASARRASGQQVTLSGGTLPSPNATQPGACEDAVQSIAYTVVMGRDGQIVSIEADVVLGNAAVNAAGLIVLQQGFAVTFRTSADQVGPSDRAPPAAAPSITALCVSRSSRRLRKCGVSPRHGDHGTPAESGMAQQRKPRLSHWRHAARGEGHVL